MSRAAAAMGFAVESLDYRGIEDPAGRVAKLVAFCRRLDHAPLLVGSSMGGHVAAAASAETPARGLFLIAPAFYMPGYESLTPHPGCRPICVVHGWQDEVVPAENSIRWSREHGAELHLICGDHRLAGALDTVVRLFEGFLAALDPD